MGSDRKEQRQAAKVMLVIGLAVAVIGAAAALAFAQGRAQTVPPSKHVEPMVALCKVVPGTKPAARTPSAIRARSVLTSLMRFSLRDVAR